MPGRANPIVRRGARLDSVRGGVPHSDVANATRMQERRSTRAVAALAAAILILVGWLRIHHQADVAHVSDGAGHVTHALALAEPHKADRSEHLHGQAPQERAPEACALLAISLVRIVPAAAVPVSSWIIVDAVRAPPIAAAPRALVVYRIAPKTSPPARV